MIGVAIIGVGQWGHKIAREYLALQEIRPDVRLVAVADSSEERIRGMLESYGASNLRGFSDLGQVLSSSEIDAVHIATPMETHYETALRVLRAGKHALVEKPLTTNSREALELVMEASKNSATMLVGHIYRFNNAIEVARRAIANGEIGVARTVEMDWLMTSPPSGTERDIIFDLAPHPIDILNIFLGSWPAQVYVLTRKHDPKRDLPDFAKGILGMPDGVLASLTLSWAALNIKRRSVTINGSKGTLVVDALNQSVEHKNLLGESRLLDVQQNNTILSIVGHFVDVIKGDSQPVNDGYVGATCVSVLEAMRQSATNGQVVPVLEERIRH